jgi:3-deoxy-D-manno-octulosonic-acid transferase
MFAYKFLITLLYPLICIYLAIRRRRGKEDSDPARFAERFGRSSASRPSGFLIWLHGASVGEINSMRGLIRRLRKDYPRAAILLTSGTVGAAKIAKNFDVMHQYAPIDAPPAVRRFMRHWRPDLAVRVDSDLWPLQLEALRAAKVPNFLINGAMSEKSFMRHLKNKKFARGMMSSFTAIMAKSKADASRFERFGAGNVLVIDNLKYTNPPAADKPDERKTWMEAASGRSVWHAAVLGEGESEIVFAAHRLVLKKIPNALLLVTPRHPNMKEELARSAAASGLEISFRSDGGAPTGDMYVADTLGEMGLFYRCADIAFMGRSLLPDCRGSSPIEAMQLGNVILTGKFTSTFNEVYDEMAADGVLERIADSAGLAEGIAGFLGDKKLFETRSAALSRFMAKKENVMNVVMNRLNPYLIKAAGKPKA